MKKIRGLYLVTSSLSEDALLTLVQDAIEGGASIVQLRDKVASEDVVYRKAKRILPLLRAANIPLIINDHWGVAKELGVGLHIGMDDGDPQEARDFLGRDALLGITVHTQIQRVLSFQGVADYVGVGPVFPTKTKKDARPVCGVQGLQRMVHDSPLPVVAIGGIGSHNIHLLREANPAAVAVCSDVCAALNPKEAVQTLIRNYKF